MVGVVWLKKGGRPPPPWLWPCTCPQYTHIHFLVYLKLHKYVGWELNSVAEDKEDKQESVKPVPVTNKISYKPIPENGPSADHSRLLPLLLEEEVSDY